MTPLTASSTLSEIGWEKFQSTPGTCCSSVIHGGDQIVFRCCGTPRAILDAGQQIHEEFRVVKAAGIAAIIGTADLAHDLLDLGKAGEHEPRAFS